MRAAAKARDAQAFNEYVDVAKLRDNLKGQLSARLAGAIGPDAQGSEARRAGTALGTALGVALVGKAVDALVQPDTVMQAMSAGKAVGWLQRLPGVELDQPADPAERREVEWRLHREGADRVAAYAVAAKAADGAARADWPDQGIGLVFELSGLAEWKLAFTIRSCSCHVPQDTERASCSQEILPTLSNSMRSSTSLHLSLVLSHRDRTNSSLA